ncbi:cytochrome b/b6 domain-containing protein [Celerinatantimonas sp. YJH-8]|uniref:cytochrome b/b6 domain-containing protein n=1 Tax=Celerinatantimonas sp. YJH-8 TaxID=3228714 RepID=UPI0038C7A2C1
MNKIYVWDWFVRLTHWIVAILFLANYFVLPKGSEPHQIAGYIVIGAVVLRLLWGLVTHSPARLSEFKPSIPKALDHIRSVIATGEDDHVGHNPAGAIMIWAMWALILITAFTGWGTQLDAFIHAKWLRETHEIFANITMLAVAVHISAIVVMTRLTHRSYVKGMWFQRKQ